MPTTVLADVETLQGRVRLLDTFRPDTPLVTLKIGRRQVVLNVEQASEVADGLDDFLTSRGIE